MLIHRARVVLECWPAAVGSSNPPVAAPSVCLQPLGRPVLVEETCPLSTAKYLHCQKSSAKVWCCCSVYELPNFVNVEPVGHTRRSEESHDQQGMS